jgi:hypothetical protein
METHLAGKTTEKRQNFDPSTHPPSTENLHFTLNREITRSPRLPVAHAHMAYSTVVLPQTTLGQNRIAHWIDRPPPEEKKEKLSNKQ